MLRKGFMLVVFGLLILVAASSSTFAADITGVWQYESMPDSTVTIAQDGSALHVCAYHGLNGTPAAIISYGTGTIDGSTTKLKFKVVRRPNSTWGGSTGVTYQDLTVSPDGKTITGTWRNDLGQGTAAKLVRVH
ncbi:MAG: hypothetical protein LAO04_20400 [Acidobacteriia bacterium]|nr:hypothetical protein [Terriglobia bacterium]